MNDFLPIDNIKIILHDFSLHSCVFVVTTMQSEDRLYKVCLGNLSDCLCPFIAVQKNLSLCDLDKKRISKEETQVKSEVF